MSRLSSLAKRWWVAAHVLAVVAYFGGLLGMLVAMGGNGGREAAGPLLRSFDLYLVLPGAFLSVLTGAVLAMWGPWGIAGYRWLAAKWVGTFAAILFGGSFARSWVHQGDPADVQGLLTIGVVCSLALLTALTVVSYLKPGGRLDLWSRHVAGRSVEVAQGVAHLALCLIALFVAPGALTAGVGMAMVLAAAAGRFARLRPSDAVVVGLAGLSWMAATASAWLPEVVSGGAALAFRLSAFSILGLRAAVLLVGLERLAAPPEG